jgi:hypothetical protein
MEAKWGVVPGSALLRGRVARWLNGHGFDAELRLPLDAAMLDRNQAAGQQI